MNRRRRLGRWGLLPAVVFALLFLEARRPRGGGWEPGLLAGAFRGPLVGLTWLRADLAFRKGRYGEAARLLRRVTQLNPASAAAWDVAAWHLAYNLARREPDPERRWRSYAEALSLLEEGLRRLPGERRLARALVRLCLEKLRPVAARCRQSRGVWPEELALAAARRWLAGGTGEDGLLLLSAAEAAGVRRLVVGRPAAAAVAFQTAQRAAAALRQAVGQLPAWQEALAATDRILAAWLEVARLERAARVWQESGRPAQARAARAAALKVLAELAGLLPADREEDVAAVRRALRRSQEKGHRPVDR